MVKFKNLLQLLVFTKVAFRLGQITPRKMVVCLLKLLFYFTNGQVYGVLRRIILCVNAS